MNDGKGYYKLLNITVNATQSEIKKAYRIKAHEIHPDKNNNSNTTQLFQQLNEAYEILNNIEKRNKYDNNTSINLDFHFGEDEAKSHDFKKYSTTSNTLKCNCEDWKVNRKNYPLHDPRRLCKHLVANFSVLVDHFNYGGIQELKLPEDLKPFNKYLIEARYAGRGVKLFYEIVFLKSSIVVLDYYGTHLYLYLKKQADDFLSYKVFEVHKYKGVGYKWMYKDDTPIIYKDNIDGKDYINKRFNLLNNDIQLGNKLYRTIKEEEEFEKKRKEWGKKREEWDREKKQQEIKHLQLQKKLSNYIKTPDIIHKMNLKYTTRSFNKKLKTLGYIEKSKYLNNDNWILKNNGLIYGMNYSSGNILSHAVTSNSYDIMYFDYKTLSFRLKEKESSLTSTTIMWNRELFNELLIVMEQKKEHTEDNNVIHNKEKIVMPDVLNTDKKYIDTKSALALCSSPISYIIFNKIIKELDIIKKIEYKPNIFSKWVLVNNGLTYGDNVNYSTDYGGLSYIDIVNLKPFNWIEYKDNEYISHNDYFQISNDKLLADNTTKNNKLFPHTTIEWKSDKFLELYIIVLSIFNKSKKPKSKNQITREEWLKDVECPICQGKNIHKKDIRQRKDYKVQRFQCWDCKKTFQKKIEDE